MLSSPIWTGWKPSAFITMIDAVAGSPELSAIVRDIGTGSEIAVSPRVYQAIESLDIDTTTLRNIARQAMSGGGRVTAKAVGLEGAFNVTNPRAIAYARTLSAENIVGISRTVRRTIRDIIADGIEEGSTPAEVARRIKNEIGLTPQYAGAVKNYRKKLIANGRSASEANRLAQKYAERLLKKRAQTIARTEIAIATNAGQHEFWRQMKDSGSIPPTAMRMWITAKDEKTCDICGPMDGLLAPIDGVWSGIYSEAHAHPNCRCTSGLVFPSPVKKMDPLGLEHWLLQQGKTLGQIYKHLAGQHDQQSHGQRGGTPSPMGREQWASLRGQFDDKADSLGDAGIYEVRNYMFMDYPFINKTLRTGFKPGVPQSEIDRTNQQIESIDKAFEQTSITSNEPILTFRGLTVDPGGSVPKIGDVIEDKAFVSTTAIEGRALEFARASESVTAGTERVLIKVVVPAGTPFIVGTKKVSSYPQEQEVLLKRGTKMRVTESNRVEADPSYEDSQPYTEITVEVVP